MVGPAFGPDGQSAVADERLYEVLSEASRLGFIGGHSLVEHVAHARRFGEAVAGADTVLDLGSGGGLPGLVLAWDQPELVVVLLDANAKRTDFLQRAIGRLGFGERVHVWAGRAETIGRDARHRASQAAVVSRSFGSPSRTAECASPFLRVGGRFVVSEPPASADRWPLVGLARLGLRPVGERSGGGLRTFEQATLCPDAFPRRRLEPPLF
jgi:16S rRNA (guanine527-N7)-methyltransferase